ncbi:MAG TPA: sodium:solute symporter, partial [Candidatus Hydrogenedentes bacterium]|nr:sodium:solute symporter [Candidatus Hydrogenedentota bacterium]
MRVLDIIVLIVYFGSMSLMGVYFTRKSGTTEGYFVGNRSYPGWLIGVSLFGATISSITFVAYPADAFKTAYLRLLLCFMLPVGVLIAS